MEITGVPQGMTLYHVHASVQFTTPKGWGGAPQLPTFFTVGGTADDAEANARAILKFREGDTMPDWSTVTRVYVSATCVEVTL